MNILLAFVTLTGISCAHGQEKGNSIIPFPRIGRSNGNAPGLIPFPRIGRDGGGFHEMKRQLIPFPRVGKRFPMYMDPYYADYEAQFAPWYDPTGEMMAASYAAADKDDNVDVDKKSSPSPNAGGGMWFGPRLGKRKKRSIEESSTERSRDTLDTRTLAKILHNFNWAIVPIKERRTFTPRLGRSSGEISVQTRAQPLTPRLGRSREMVSAELDVEEDGANRYARNEEHSRLKGTQLPPIEVSGPPFSPRLGRADHYSSRLRTGDDHE